jgi:glycerol-1-phosphate dehydrogenase [NAD(P)+]
MTVLFHPLPIIDDVVAHRYQAPELGGPLRPPLRRIAVADSLDGAEAELVASLDLGPRLAVVGDENTWPVLGARVAAALPGAEAIVLEHPKADEANADLLQERTRHADGLVAVGSGTINDLCKYVTHRTGRRSAVFATAASMDGYVTTTVSITRGGFKLSLPAHSPAGVFFDLSVLAAAPLRMMRAGLGDTVCRTTAQVDWLLSHLLLDTVYAKTPYRLMAEDEPRLYALADRLPERDLAAMLSLTRLLILSGLGVLVTGTSHCGSMGEHAISHFIDTFARPHPKTLHGEQVGIATWSMARLQEAMLASPDAPVLEALRVDEARYNEDYGPLAPSCLEAVRRKPFDPQGTERLNRRLAERWPAMRQQLQSVILPSTEIARVMRAAGAPLTAGELGVDPAFYRRAVGHAHELRDRYCFLDLAAQSGRLAEFVAGEG